MKSVFRRLAFFGFCMVAAAVDVRADDWPQWRGPDRNGISKETGLLKQWPKEGPPLRWRVSDLGAGYAAPSVAGARLYLIGNEGLENELVQARAVADGTTIWKTRLGKVGPNPAEANYAAARSTPTVEGEVLYVLGSDGDLACLETGTGTVRWRKNLPSDFGGKPGSWAYAESPLIDGDKLICTPGGSDATMLALNKKTGEVIWKAAAPDASKAAFASPIIVEADGVRQYVQLVQKGLVGVEAQTGKLLWHYPKPVSRFDANIPSPLGGDGYVYVASAGTGAGAVKLNVKNGAVQAEEAYFGPKFPTAIGGAIKIGDYLYGTSGQALLCFEFKTGQLKWEERALGAASMCYADGHLYLHSEIGEVGLVEASPEAYREKGRFSPPDRPARVYSTEKTWAYPVVANGSLYIREHGTLWSYDVRGGR